MYIMLDCVRLSQVHGKEVPRLVIAVIEKKRKAKLFFVTVCVCMSVLVIPFFAQNTEVKLILYCHASALLLYFHFTVIRFRFTGTY